MVKRVVASCSVALMALLMTSISPGIAHAGGANDYEVHNLVANLMGVADHTDPNLVNAWGLAAGPTTPWWVADNETSVSTLYDGTGAAMSLVVGVAGNPTGTVFNGGTGFKVRHGGVSAPSLFLFDTEAGTIRGWNPGVPPPAPSTHSFKVVDKSKQDAVFKGLAIASTHRGDLIYATDFHNGRVDVFDEHFHRVLRDRFVDPQLPKHYAPFGIQTIRGAVFVTYAKQDPNSDDELHGAGFGFVDKYSLRGRLLARVASRNALNAPWGLAWAPQSFGKFGGDLLVGNFGDGKINAYAWSNGHYHWEGVLRDAMGSPISIDGLWALEFGMGGGGASGPKTTLFFTAGPNDESEGLFGSIVATPVY
jgi:uncharacterized protein (TIGR03118 family)